MNIYIRIRLLVKGNNISRNFTVRKNLTHK
jgi:hypothetical protein